MFSEIVSCLNEFFQILYGGKEYLKYKKNRTAANMFMSYYSYLSDIERNVSSIETQLTNLFDFPSEDEVSRERRLKYHLKNLSSTLNEQQDLLSQLWEKTNSLIHFLDIYLPPDFAKKMEVIITSKFSFVTHVDRCLCDYHTTIYMPATLNLFDYDGFRRFYNESLDDALDYSVMRENKVFYYENKVELYHKYDLNNIDYESIKKDSMIILKQMRDFDSRKKLNRAKRDFADFIKNNFKIEDLL